MSQKVQDILKKINYIEADLEIHKQILFSIPSADRGEMERVMQVIAEKKEMINSLRDQIRLADPIEFGRILKIEKAVSQFKKMASETKFNEIFTMNNNEPCTISMQSGKTIDCLVKAKDQAGDWTILTLDGEILRVLSASVQSIR